MDANNFAIMSYSFHGLHNCGAMNIFGYLESMKYRYNLTTADIWNGFFDSYEDDYIDMVAQHVKDRGLRVVNLCCDEAHVWDNDPEKRKRNEERALKCIEVARKLGAQTIRIDVGVREESMSDEQFKYVADKYTEYCKLAAEFGAKLGPENHWGAARMYPEFLRLTKYMIEERKVENYGILLHLGGWTDATTDEERDSNDIQLINYAMHMHMDYQHSMRAHEIVPKLSDKGYFGCWTVEHHSGINEYNNAGLQLTMLKSALMPLEYDGQWPDAPPSVKA